MSNNRNTFIYLALSALFFMPLNLFAEGASGGAADSSGYNCTRLEAYQMCAGYGGKVVITSVIQSDGSILQFFACKCPDGKGGVNYFPMPTEYQDQNENEIQCTSLGDWVQFMCWPDHEVPLDTSHIK